VDLHSAFSGGIAVAFYLLFGSPAKKHFNKVGSGRIDEVVLEPGQYYGCRYMEGSRKEVQEHVKEIMQEQQDNA
jgi:hypothetical protein